MLKGTFLLPIHPCLGSAVSSRELLATGSIMLPSPPTQNDITDFCVTAHRIRSADQLPNHFSFVDGWTFESALMVVGKLKAIEA